MLVVQMLNNACRIHSSLAVFAQRVRVTLLAARFAILLKESLREIRKYRQILQFRQFRNDPAIKTYYRVIIVICVINLDKKINLYNNPKSVFTNLIKYIQMLNNAI